MHDLAPKLPLIFVSHFSPLHSLTPLALSCTFPCDALAFSLLSDLNQVIPTLGTLFPNVPQSKLNVLALPLRTCHNLYTYFAGLFCIKPVLPITSLNSVKARAVSILFTIVNPHAPHGI